MKKIIIDYKWIIAAVIFSGGIYLLYDYNQYDALEMGINHEEAVQIASNFLVSLKIPVENYEKERYVIRNADNNDYYLKSLGNDKYKGLIASQELPVHGWEVLFHKNQSKDIPQTSYSVFLTYTGKLQGFRRRIPDSLQLPSVSSERAEEIMTNFLEDNVGFDLSDFDLVSKNVNSLGSRSDYNFRWETVYQEPKGVLALEATLQGDMPGSFDLKFRLPENTERGMNITSAIYNTVSIVFIFFLTQFAFYFFIKKYHQGEVWLKIGRNIFIVFYLILIVGIVNYWPSIGHGVGMGNLSLILTKIILFLLLTLILNLILGLLVFTSWTVSESFGRELWPQKLKGIDAFFKGKFFTLGSGTSVFFGFVISLAVVFIFNLLEFLLNNGTNELFISYNDNLELFSGSFPAISVIFGGLEYAFMSSIVIGFFVINISYQKWKKKWLSIIITGIVATLSRAIIIPLPSLSVIPYDIIVNFLFGCFFAYIYFRFDLLTIFSMFFNMSLLSGGLILLASNNPSQSQNLIPVGIFLLISPVIYIISRFRRDEFVLENYGLPSHIARISERERLKKEMEIAAKVQLSLLPKENPHIAGYDIAGLSIPAVEAGGDYYDFVKLDNNKIGIAIGDVSGKGVGAAIYMTLTKGILQAHAEENVSPKIVLDKVNRLLFKTIEKNSFVSMFYTILDTTNHTLSFARAGHNPAIFHSRLENKTYFVSGDGIALGLEEGEIFRRTLKEYGKNMEPGDIVIYYTDGFTEAMNEHREQFGEKKLIDLVDSNKNKSAGDLIDTILRNVRKFTDNYPQHDDMTIVVIKRTSDS